MAIKIATIEFILEDVLVDPFMTDRHLFFGFNPKTDLFLTPIHAKQVFDMTPNRLRDARPGLGVTSFVSQSLSLFRTIVAQPGIAFKLPTDGRFISAQYHSFLRMIMPCFQQGVNLVSFFLGKLRVTHGAPLSWRTEKTVDFTAACPLPSR